MTPSLIDSALDLVERGFRVFPVHSVAPTSSGRLACTCGRPTCDSPAKHPFSRFAPHGASSASNDPGVVAKWWRARPDASIGLATDDIVVVDVDPRKAGADSLEKLERSHGAFPATWRCFTGGGGEHIYFKAPPALRIKNSVEKLGPGLDVRARGGYVLAPPSLHASGQRYAWNVDFHPDHTPVAKIPGWLCDLAGDAPSASNTVPRISAAIWQNIAADGVCEGGRNDSIARLSGHLLRRFVDPIVTVELMTALNIARFRPPLSEAEIRKIVNSIASKELKRRRAADGKR